MAVNDYLVAQILTAISEEYRKAREVHNAMHSPHEAFGVITEEIDEYKEHMRAYPNQDDAAAVGELIQIAAMCIAAAIEVHNYE